MKNKGTCWEICFFCFFFHTNSDSFHKLARKHPKSYANIITALAAWTTWLLPIISRSLKSSVPGPWQRNFIDARFPQFHVSDRLELHNNNRASWILHPGPSESDVYSDVIQEAQLNDLLHTVRLLMRLDTPLHGNNARGAKYAVYYMSVATHTVFENIKMAALRAMSD